MKILSVVGARPNFMKIAPLDRAIKKMRGVEHIIVHTGQHYDYKMSESFFKELGIPKPHVNLEVGSLSHAQQTGQIMLKFEKVIKKFKPDVLVVVGDVNSTMACSLVATKLRIPVAHVEAGLRSFDRDMPEETNRLVTDSVSDILLTTSPEAKTNLMNEGVPSNRIFFVGNVMIDNLMNNKRKAMQSKICEDLKVLPKEYALCTLHRPSNVDDRNNFMQIYRALESLQKDINVVFPIHPRTRKHLYKYVSKKRLKAAKNLQLIDPLGYFDFLALMMNAKFAVTDSGGIQEETTVLRVPCLTVRENTERPITITEGSNVLVGVNTRNILREGHKILKGQFKKSGRPKFWDGKASERIVTTLVKLHKGKRLIRCV